MDNTTITETVILTREEYDKMIADIRELREAAYQLAMGNHYSIFNIYAKTAHYEDKP